MVVLLVQETLEGREASRDDKFKIAQLALGEDDVGDSLGLLEELVMNGQIADDKILEDSTVRSVSHAG